LNRFLQKLYPDLLSINFLTSLESIPFDMEINDAKRVKTMLNNSSSSNVNSSTNLPPDSLTYVNILNQKSAISSFSLKQLEPFIDKINERKNFDAVLSVLQELDKISQRQPNILSHFVYHLQNLVNDKSSVIRDLAISLIMRYLRLNSK
jgi:hypothetical protein